MILIGVAGGSGSGKTTFAKRVFDHFGADQAIIISQDNYYHDQSEKFDHDGGSVNFDHPDSIDFDLMFSHISTLLTNTIIKCPIYDFATHKRLEETISIAPKKIIILDGILIYTHKNLREIIHHKLFTDCPEDLRYKRRLKRDIEERGRTEQGVYNQFYNQVKPMHDEFVKPSSQFADEIIVPDNFDLKCKEWINKIESLII